MDNFKETFQSLGCLGWAMAAIGWIAAACLLWAQTGTDEGIEDLTRQKDELNSENSDLCRQNKALESRNKLLIQRIAELEPKADTLDKMRERADIVKAAYEQHTKKGQCPVQHHQVLGKDHVHTWTAYLN